MTASLHVFSVCMYYLLLKWLMFPLLAVGYVIAGLANLGLPGLSGFVAEMTVFVDSYPVDRSGIWHLRYLRYDMSMVAIQILYT